MRETVPPPSSASCNTKFSAPRLGKSNYVCQTIALGANTDPYQPIEREYKITRSIIKVLHECKHPLMIVTKSWLVERDIDLLGPMAESGLVQVHISITTLDSNLARKMEPRASAPGRRLETVARLKSAGIPVGVMFAPVIPRINDAEMETILEKSAAAGASSAAYVMLRLPYEIKQLFKDWLDLHEPLKAKHVMSMVRDIRQGKENDANFHTRMQGTGIYAEMIRKRFIRACKSLKLNLLNRSLDTGNFISPQFSNQQLSLFDLLRT